MNETVRLSDATAKLVWPVLFWFTSIKCWSQTSLIPIKLSDILSHDISNNVDPFSDVVYLLFIFSFLLVKSVSYSMCVYSTELKEILRYQIKTSKMKDLLHKSTLHIPKERKKKVYLVEHKYTTLIWLVHTSWLSESLPYSFGYVKRK